MLRALSLMFTFPISQSPEPYGIKHQLLSIAILSAYSIVCHQILNPYPSSNPKILKLNNSSLRNKTDGSRKGDTHNCNYTISGVYQISKAIKSYLVSEYCLQGIHICSCIMCSFKLLVKKGLIQRTKSDSITLLLQKKTFRVSVQE